MSLQDTDSDDAREIVENVIIKTTNNDSLYDTVTDEQIDVTKRLLMKWEQNDEDNRRVVEEVYLSNSNNNLYILIKSQDRGGYISTKQAERLDGYSLESMSAFPNGSVQFLMEKETDT